MAIFGRKKTESVSTASERRSSPSRGMILRGAHMTEKTSGLGERWATFVVGKSATKPEVKSAVEERYGVHVEKITIVRLPDKMRMRGKQLGRRPGIKKAYVRLRAGERIEIAS